MIKIKIHHCGKEIIVEEKDLKKGIFKKKGYEFEIQQGSEEIHPSIFSFKYTYTSRPILKTFKLLENIKLKYIICPICEEKVWVIETLGWNELSDGWIFEKGYKVVQISERNGKWREEVYRGCW